MRLFYTFLLCVLFTATTCLQTRADSSESNCLECHRDFEDDDGPSHLFTRDIHFQKGLGCSDCHGGDPDADDMDVVRASSDFLGVPDHFEVPSFCARCHSDAAYMHDRNPALPVDQLEKYRTSIHGIRLFQDKDDRVANCVSCHSAHQIGDPKMPHSTTYPLNLPHVCGSCHADSSYMSNYNIPTNQLALYKQSVHGIALLENHDLGAPACNDCHGNHGAAPPGVTSLSAVCGRCHAIEAALFTESTHYTAFLENELSMCETCHAYHGIMHPTDSLIGFEEPGLCGDCHAADEDSPVPMVVDSLRSVVFRLSHSADEARLLLDEASIKGMMTTEEEFILKEVSQSIHTARAAIHAFSIDSLVPHAVQGIANAEKVRQRAVELIDEYYFRRWGFAVATIIISLLAAALYFKIRRIEK